MATKAFPAGVYAASLTWFSDDPQQEIDYDLQSKHLSYLIKGGLTGVVIAGSNGEAVALRAVERMKLISLTREIAIQCGRKDLPIIIGTVGQTTREIIEQLRAAKEAGADYGLVLTPSYFHFAMDPAAITKFFQEVADASPIPILIYSWPLVTSGIEVSSDIMSVLGRHPNIVGTKLTCGGVGKAVRVTADFDAKEFCVLSGFADWMIPALSVGGAGCIAGFANLCPRASVKVYQDYQAGKVKEALALQHKLAKAEWELTKAGINGTKWAVAKLLGYDMSKCYTRKPYPKYEDTAAQTAVLSVLESFMEVENGLGK